MFRSHFAVLCIHSATFQQKLAEFGQLAWSILVTGDVRDYCTYNLSSNRVGFDTIVAGAGGPYPNAECGRNVL
jgi:hypothetical protein